MDGFGGYNNAATDTLPGAVTVMDPFHVVGLAGHKLDLCRQRIQHDTRGHRGCCPSLILPMTPSSILPVAGV